MLIVGQDSKKIGKLKKEMSKTFDMKDLGPTQQILGIQICRDSNAKKLWLSREEYAEWVLAKFNIKDTNLVSMPIIGHFKLSKR